MERNFIFLLGLKKISQRKMVRVLILFLLLSLTNQTFAQDNDSNDSICKGIVQNMLSNIDQMESAHFKMLSTERYFGEMKSSNSEVHITFSPQKKVYLKVIEPNGSNGPELLYLEGENNNEVLISPNKFPYINLSLSPQNSFLRRNRHHTILEAGGKYMGTIVETSFKKALENDFGKYFKLLEDTIFKGIPCHVIHVDNPNFNYFSYTSKKGETVLSIARKFSVSEYKIMEANQDSDLDGYTDELDVLELKIPNSYSNHFVLFIEKENYLPIYQEIYDDLGLFGIYEYKLFEPNPDLPINTFSSENPAYGF